MDEESRWPSVSEEKKITDIQAWTLINSKIFQFLQKNLRFFFSSMRRNSHHLSTYMKTPIRFRENRCNLGANKDFTHTHTQWQKQKDLGFEGYHVRKSPFQNQSCPFLCQLVREKKKIPHKHKHKPRIISTQKWAPYSFLGLYILSLIEKVFVVGENREKLFYRKDLLRHTV